MDNSQHNRIGGGVRTRGGKVTLGRRTSSGPNSSSGTRGGVRTRGGNVGTRGGSGTRGICIQEVDSRSSASDTLGRRRSQESSSISNGKRPLEKGEYRTTCGRHVLIRGGKGGGVARSNSRVARGDEMADMAGVIRNTMGLHAINDVEDEYDYDEDDGSDHDDVDENDGGEGVGFEDGGFEDGNGEDGGGERPWIKCIGKKFACGVVHRSAIDILNQNCDGDWPTFSKIPHSKLRELFNIFRTKWRWDTRDDQHTYDAFVFVLKKRFPDLMKELRDESKRKAVKDGHVIAFDEHKFDITCNYPPDKVPLDKWKRLCKIWNTQEWLEKSKVGRSNRNKDRSRHAGGSMGFDEHRVRMEKQKGEKVGYKFVFVDTHATKKTKKRLREGEITIDDLDQLEFVTEKSKESYTLFTKELKRVYGSDNERNVDRDEFAVWESLNPKSRFGIGSSDPRFMVTGTPSSFCGSTNSDARQLQEVQHVRSELEKEREARQSLEDRLELMEIEREQERAEREKEQAERENFKNQWDEVMKKIADN